MKRNKDLKILKNKAVKIKLPKKTKTFSGLPVDLNEFAWNPIEFNFNESRS